MGINPLCEGILLLEGHQRWLDILRSALHRIGLSLIIFPLYCSFERAQRSPMAGLFFFCNHVGFPGRNLLALFLDVFPCIPGLDDSFVILDVDIFQILGNRFCELPRQLK
jgi:hypothetical protein